MLKIPITLRQTGIFMSENLKELLVEINKSNELTLFFTNLWKEDLSARAANMFYYFFYHFFRVIFLDD